MNPNNTNFPSQLYEELKKVPKKHEEDGFYYHQRITYSYVMKNPNLRGILICFSTGYGKTRIASALAEMGLEDGWEPIILSAKTLHSNFKKGLMDYKKTLPKHKKKSDAVLSIEIEDQYEFVSSNASNMADQMQRLGNKDDVGALEEKMETMMDNVSSLEGKYLIVDEAHNLFNAITNGSKNAIRLYQMIMNTRKIKMIFLTANPIINDPFELVPCFNMIEGYLYETLSNGRKKKHTLFPEDWSDFNKYFVDMENLGVKNADKLKNRILGKISYYGSLYEGSPKSQTGRKDVIARVDFPDEASTKVVKVPMGKEQFAQYIIAEDIEQKESKKVYGYKQKAPLERPGMVTASSYRIRTRQISNFLFPKYVDKKQPPEVRVQQLKDEDVKDLSKYGTKLAEIKKNLTKHSKNIVYSQFLNGTIRVLEKHLELNGWVKWRPDFPDLKKPSPKTRVFAEISGDVSGEDRSKTLEYFNDEKNKYGAMINELFITAAGSEGLDTQDVDAVHQTEPYWNPARDMQVRARAIRLRSHNRRPAKDRLVQPYLYLSVPPENSDRTKLTTDQELYTRSKNASILNQKFFNLLIEASIDCLIHSSDAKVKEFEEMGLNCVHCQPTGKQLYTANVEDDLKSQSPCQSYKEEKIKVKMIKINGEKYYYQIVDTGLEVYKFDESINAYVPVDEREEEYSQIAERI